MKCDLWRIAEEQATSTLQNNIPDTSMREIDFLEELVGETKPQKNLQMQFIQQGYDFLVYSQFRYPPPVDPRYMARFKPPYHQTNVFYGAVERETVYREYGYHFLRQRIHIKDMSHYAENRTLFTVEFKDPAIVRLHDHPEVTRIMSRTDYSASHAFVLSTPCSSILYPSARYPDGNCVAVNDIKHLGREPKYLRNITTTLDPMRESCLIKTHTGNIEINWSEVS